MSKKVIIIVVAVLVLAGGGAAAYFMTKDDTPASNDEHAAGHTDAETNEQINGNIFTLAEGGHAHKCIYNYSGENGKSSGTMYTDGNGRGLMQMTLETERGNSAANNVLVTKDKVYSWTTTDGKTMGIQYNLSAYKKMESQPSGDGQASSGPAPDQKFDLDCGEWTVDESVLAVPENVEFSSLPQAQ